MNNYFTVFSNSFLGRRLGFDDKNQQSSSSEEVFSLERDIAKQEQEVFFTLATKDITLFNTINHKFKYSNVEQCYFQTIDEFLKFSNTEQFDLILNEFITSLNQLDGLVAFYFTDENIKNNFSNNIDVLINKLIKKDQYSYHGISMINLFRDVKYKVYIINQILDEIQNQPEDKQIISFNQLQSLLSNTIIEGLELCLEGVYARFDYLYRNLKANILGKQPLIDNAKYELVKSLAQEVTRMYISYGYTPDRGGSEVHKNNVLIDLIADRFGIENTKDKSATDEYFNLNDDQKNEFIAKAYIELSTANLTKYLANSLYDNLYFFLDYNKITALLTVGITDDEIPAGVMGEIEKNFLASFHMQYQINEETSKIKISDILSYKEDENECFYSIIENIQTKLHVWVVKALLPTLSPTVLAKIPQQLFCNNEALVIARLGNCYFWVASENSINIEQEYGFDYTDKTLLTLKHLTENLIINNKLSQVTYRALISQAFNQTNNAEEIINFFSRIDIKNILQNDIALKQYLDKLISNKIIENPSLKEELLEIIYYQQLLSSTNIFDSEKFYWLLDTKLLEPVLIQLASQGIDISDNINNLTIAQILNLEYRDSILKLYQLANININNINYQHFCFIFQNLMEYGDSNVIIKLIYSGLVNFLLNSKNTLDNSLLSILIAKQDIETIKIIAQASIELPSYEQIDFNERDSQGNTAVKLAVLKNNYLCLRALLQTQILNINDTYENELTALMLAVRDNHIDCVKELIQYDNVDINKQEYDGYSVLMIAVEAKHTGCLKLLLNRTDINLDLKNSQDETAVDIAINEEYDDELELLVNYSNIYGMPILIQAIETGENNYIEKFLDNKAIDVNVQASNSKNTALIQASSLNKKHNVVQLLAHENINLNIQNHQGYTALMIAAFEGHADIVKQLLAHENIHLNIQNHQGYTALMIAATKGYTDIVKQLLAHENINLNIQNHQGYTALMIAAAKGYIDIVKQLLQHIKIDMNIADNDFRTACIHALLSRQFNCFKILIEDKQLDINRQYKLGNTILIIAIDIGYDEAIELLIQQENINLNIQNNAGWTALMMAAYHKNNSCLKQLLRCNNIDKSIKNNQGKTAINVALSVKNFIGIKHLMFRSNI